MAAARAQFGLLGPLSVSSDGEPIALGGQKRRALLAVLLLEANQVVSGDRLIDALWGEDPPETARNTIQVYISQLRKLLPDGALEGSHTVAGRVINVPVVRGGFVTAANLASVRSAGARRIAVVLPIKPEAHDAVRMLLNEGPPFDPDQMTGLDRHEVFLTPDEAIFLFDSQFGADALESLLTKPELWQAAASWREYIAGPPRIAEGVYLWARRDEPEELSYLPTPGAGDSDGGDIF